MNIGAGNGFVARDYHAMIRSYADLSFNMILVKWPSKRLELQANRVFV